MKLRVGRPPDLMLLLVWSTLFTVGISLAADCALHIFNWLAGSR